MRVMVFGKATDGSEKSAPPTKEAFAAMDQFTEDLVKAGRRPVTGSAGSSASPDTVGRTTSPFRLHGQARQTTTIHLLSTAAAAAPVRSVRDRRMLVVQRSVCCRIATGSSSNEPRNGGWAFQIKSASRKEYARCVEVCQQSARCRSERNS
jgi:hypothetical protein